MNKFWTLLYLSVILFIGMVYPQSNNEKYQAILDNAHKEGLQVIVIPQPSNIIILINSLGNS